MNSFLAPNISSAHVFSKESVADLLVLYLFGVENLAEVFCINLLKALVLRRFG